MRRRPHETNAYLVGLLETALNNEVLQHLTKESEQHLGANFAG